MVFKTDFRLTSTQNIFHQALQAVIMTTFHNNNPPTQTLAFDHLGIILHIVVQLYCSLISFKGYWQNKTNVRNIWEEAARPTWGVLNAINSSRLGGLRNVIPLPVTQTQRRYKWCVARTLGVIMSFGGIFPAFIFRCSSRGLIWILLTQ